MCFLVAALTHLFSREKGATASAIVDALVQLGNGSGASLPGWARRPRCCYAPFQSSSCGWVDRADSVTRLASRCRKRKTLPSLRRRTARDRWRPDRPPGRRRASGATTRGPRRHGAASGHRPTPRLPECHGCGSSLRRRKARALRDGDPASRLRLRDDVEGFAGKAPPVGKTPPLPSPPDYPKCAMASTTKRLAS